MKFLKTKKVPLPEILRSCIGTVLAVTVAIVAMMLLDAVHPPGGATALLCMLQKHNQLYLPAHTSCSRLCCIAAGSNNCFQNRPRDNTVSHAEKSRQRGVITLEVS